MAFDPTTTMNFIFSVIIVILGFWVYKVKNNVLALYIALAFGLFAISHLSILLGTPSTSISIIIIRALGYLVVIFALSKEILRK
jgi:hypothetical protein